MAGGDGLRDEPLKERSALRALRSRSIPEEFEAFFASPQKKNGIFDKRSALRVKRSSSAALN